MEEPPDKSASPSAKQTRLEGVRGAGNEWLSAPNDLAVTAPADARSTAPVEVPRALNFEERYTLVSELARGGMGRVMSALDRSIGREVAIKESLTNNSARSTIRFVRESLMTARLQHPNIISVYDVGRRATGEPYIVMRLVHGKPLLEVIEATQTIDERLRLLPSAQAAIDALAYAHKHEIIHRDLKPSNVLVGEFGETVVIDWGLAKDLSDTEPIALALPGTTKGELTMDGAVIGTPTYMSPEQARGQPADKRSDVYALGALLYQLLSGHPPFELATSMEVLEQVMWREPKPLESCVRGLPNDLLTIVKTAMHREPAMRFPSAAELAEELRRFQSGKLVSAHQYSAGELFLRWARKHRVVLAAVVLSLVAIGVVTGISLKRIVAERDRANHEAEVARRVADFLTGMFKVADPDEARGNSVSAREVLDRASKQIDEGLAKEPAVQGQLMGVMGQVYNDLGLYPQAEQLLRKSLATSTRALGPLAMQTLAAKNEVATLYYQEGRYPEAEKMWRELLAERERTLGEDARETIGAKGNLANLLDDTGRYAEAAQLMRDGVERRTRLFGADDPETLMAAGNLISVYVHQDRGDLALAQARTVLDSDRRVLGVDHPNTMMVADEVVDLLEMSDQLAEGEALALKNIEIENRVLGSEHPETLTAMGALADIYAEEKRYPEAEALLRKTLATALRVEGPEQPDVLVMKGRLAMALAGAGKTQEGEQMMRELVATKERIFGASNPTLLDTLGGLGWVLIQEGRFEEAEAIETKILEGEKALGPDRRDAGIASLRLAAIRLARGDPDKAIDFLRGAIAHGLNGSDLKSLPQEKDLQKLAGDPRFQALLAEAKSRADRFDEPAKIPVSDEKK